MGAEMGGGVGGGGGREAGWRRTGKNWRKLNSNLKQPLKVERRQAKQKLSSSFSNVALRPQRP